MMKKKNAVVQSPKNVEKRKEERKRKKDYGKRKRRKCKKNLFLLRFELRSREPKSPILTFIL